MSEKLFGTDGIRNLYDTSETLGKVNAATFARVSQAYAELVKRPDEKSLFVVGGDTRESSEPLMQAVCNGLKASGTEVWYVGVAPTPTVAWLAQKHEANAVAITASHNGPEYNGLKLFDKGGVKPSADTQKEVEETYQNKFLLSPGGSQHDRRDLLKSYVEHTAEKLGGEGALAHKIVAIDAASGAAWQLTPQLYERLGATVIPYACAPKGHLINASGATHPQAMKAYLADRPALTTAANFIGAFANDGDADRVIGIDAFGDKVDGNYWLKELAKGQRGIVGTLYTNTVLRKTLEAMAVEFYECDNGDNYVTAMLQKLNAQKGEVYTRGGEFTGHIIDLTHLPSGDGLYMGAWLAISLAARDMSLADLHDEMTLWPEGKVDIKLDGGADAKAKLDKPIVQDTLAKVRERLGTSGNVVLRASGTEPVVRLNVEAEKQTLVDEAIVDLCVVLEH